MSELEEKLGSILSDPNMMQQLMGMAQMLSANAPAQPQPSSDARQTETPQPGVDEKTLRMLSGIARQGNVDDNQHSLLKALQPYLSRERIAKLERAMRAARMAGAASSFLNAGGIRLLNPR